MTNKNILSFSIYWIFCFIGIILQTKFNREAQTVWDNFYTLFYGVSSTGFSLNVYIFFSIVFLGYPFIFQNNVFNLINGGEYYILIRYKSYNNWFRDLFLKIFSNTILVLLILFAATVIISVSMGLELTNTLTLRNDINVYVLVYHFIVNSFLQILNYILILFIIVCLTRKVEYVLLSSGILLVLGLPMLNWYTLFPVALNGLGYISSEISSAYMKSLLLIFYILLELILIQLIFKKRKIFAE